MTKPLHCGYVGIVGRPNVGKSTLLNRILGQKISITSRKPQTTQQRILGIKTEGTSQAIYVDTPGFHLGYRNEHNKAMNQAVREALKDVDVIIFVIAGSRWTPEDTAVEELLQALTIPIIMVINKVDLVTDKEALLPIIAEHAKKYAQIIPISAQKGWQVEELENAVSKHLPAQPHFFGPDEVTDSSERFLASELIREKLMRSLGEELPYVVTVEIDEFHKKNNVLHISALIWVQKDSQKKIIVGQGGEGLRRIGEQARKDMERLFNHRIMLKTWVKVK